MGASSLVFRNRIEKLAPMGRSYGCGALLRGVEANWCIAPGLPDQIVRHLELAVMVVIVFRRDRGAAPVI